MTAVRIGVFGLLGSGNLGNDGSLEAVLGYLRAEHPDAVLDALCGGPEEVAARFGIPATRLHWYAGEYRTASRTGAIAAKGLGKFVDVVRTAAWVQPARCGDRAGHGRPGGHAAAAAVGLPVLAVPALRE